MAALPVVFAVRGGALMDGRLGDRRWGDEEYHEQRHGRQLGNRPHYGSVGAISAGGVGPRKSWTYVLEARRLAGNWSRARGPASLLCEHFPVDLDRSFEHSAVRELALDACPCGVGNACGSVAVVDQGEDGLREGPRVL